MQLCTILFKSLESVILLLIKDALNLSKVTVKKFIMLQKNKCCSFELYSSKNTEKNVKTENFAT